jgi:hypothetical protein
MSAESADCLEGVSSRPPLALRSRPWAQAERGDNSWTRHEASGRIEGPRADERRGS